LDLADRTFRSALASRSLRSLASAGDGADGESAGASTVESSSVATLGATAVARSITTRRLCTEITEASLPRAADTERAGLTEAADMRAHRVATRERHTATPAAIAAQRLTEATRGTEATLATEDSPALRLHADRAPRALVATAAAAAVSRADTLRMGAPALRTVDTLAEDTPAVDTAVVVVTVVADTAASGKRSG